MHDLLRARGWLTLLYLGAGCSAATTTTPAPEGPLSTALAGVQRTLIASQRLPNGLQVHVLEDPRAPLVSVQVWYAVGSTMEVATLPGRGVGNTGLAHLFEHLMFRGTPLFPEPTRLLTSLGAEVNAFTGFDQTVFTSYAPKEALPQILALEADRMTQLQLDFDGLEVERQVVLSELRERVRDDATGRALAALRRRAGGGVAAWPAAGRRPDVAAVTLADARAFYERWYRPEHATLVVAGDVTSAEVFSLARREFGAIEPSARGAPKPPLDASRHDRGETADRVIADFSARRVVLGYHIPPTRHADTLALEVLDALLNGTRSGLVQSELVYGPRPVFDALETAIWPRTAGDLYVWIGELNEGRSTRDALAALDELLGSLATTEPTPERTKQAITALTSNHVRHTLRLPERAEAIGHGVGAAGGPSAMLDRPAAWAQVTPADLRRVASTLLAPTNRAVVRLVRRDRVSALAETLGRASRVGGAARVALNKAAASVVARLELASVQQELRTQREALDGLRERLRAASARPGARPRTAEGRAQVDKVVARLEQRVGELNAEAAKRATALETSRRELARLRRRAKAGAAAYSDAIQSFVAVCAMPRPTTTPSGPPPDSPGALAKEALMAWLADSIGARGAASAWRSRVLAAAPSVSKAVPWDARVAVKELVDAAWDSAFDTRGGSP